MPVSRQLTFANVSSGLALVVALAGGGVAVAGTLGKNVVGSAQVKNGSLTGKDLKNDKVTGRDVQESSLGTVPRAAQSGDVLRANVFADGSIVPGSSEGVASVEPGSSIGSYDITFRRSIAGCSPIVTAFAPTTPTASADFGEARAVAGEPSVLHVQMWRHDAIGEAVPFSVVLVC